MVRAEVEVFQLIAANGPDPQVTRQAGAAVAQEVPKLRVHPVGEPVPVTITPARSLPLRDGELPQLVRVGAEVPVGTLMVVICPRRSDGP